MIKVDYVCGFANRLFQLSIANIIADHHGLMLVESPIEGLPHSYTCVEGIKVDGNPEIVATSADVSDILNRQSIDKPLVLRGLFQKAELYLKYERNIREKWLKLNSNIEATTIVANCDLLIHIRRGDYLLHNWGVPFSYYQNAIDSMKFNQIGIICDDPQDPFLRRFKHYKPLIASSHYLNDFKAIIEAKKIIMSPSTFSWWGAFLSNAEEIVFPIPQQGIWSADYVHDVDLTLPLIYSQYKYLQCIEPLKLNIIERLYFEKKYLRMKIRNQGLLGYLKGNVKSLFMLPRL